MKNMSEVDSSLVSKCMEYTMQLANQGKGFKFSLSLPSGVSFSLDYSQGETASRIPEKKKKSPSTLRRNSQRRKTFLDKKSNDKQAEEQLVHQPPTSLNPKTKCDECEDIFEDNECLRKHVVEKHKESLTCEECTFTTKSDEDLKDHKRNKHEIPQLDGNSEVKKTYVKQAVVSKSKEEYERERKEYNRKREEEAKADGSWCYECKDECMNRVVLKRHMHNDHNLEIYPDINIMLHGGWMK